MSGKTLLIKNGLIVTASDLYEGDVFIEGETIRTIGTSLDIAADRVVDVDVVGPGARRVDLEHEARVGRLPPAVHPQVERDRQPRPDEPPRTASGVPTARAISR